jgi:hypothetical protein
MWRYRLRFQRRSASSTVTPRITRRRALASGLAGAALLASRGRVAHAGQAGGDRELQFEVTDAAGGALPCRIHLTGPDGKPVKAASLPFWSDHFVCDGKASLRVPPGQYRYEIERGPEWRPGAGVADVGRGTDQPFTVKVQIGRGANLQDQGWFAGDLHVHRPVEDVPLLMRAEDLHVAPVITWWNRTNPWKDKAPPDPLLRKFDRNRFYHLMAGEDERGGGALLFFNLDRPLDIADAQREYPTAAKFGREAHERDPEVWLDAEKPFWWDVPLWAAAGLLDSVGIAHNHMWRSGVLGNEAWGRPRDADRYPDPQGNGLWSQDIYYHLLNCGLRLPPSAGSASGVLPNPVGYNRVYVHTGKDQALTWDAWWRGLKAGRCFVTNGPLLICQADRHDPGHVFGAQAGNPLELSVSVRVSSNDPIRRVEVIKNGRVDGEVRLEGNGPREWRGAGKVSFTESGWFLVRAIADVSQTFRVASTGPFYVETEGRKSRIGRASAQFFVDWTAQRRQMLHNAVKSPDELREVLAEHAVAEKFWQDLASRANAE